VSPDFMSAVFNARAGGPPESVHTAQGYVIYQVTEVKPAATPGFEEIRARVEQEFKADRAQQLLAQKTQELSDRARAEHDLKKAAKELGATVKTSELVSLESQVPDLGAMNGPAAVAFDMKQGEISGPLNTGRAGVVLTVLEKQEPAESAAAASQERIRETLLERKRNSYIEVFAANLRQQMEKEGKIRVNTQELKRLTTPTSEPGA
jgi:peptidyl-prolyl cis-trans isomerase D